MVVRHASAPRFALAVLATVAACGGTPSPASSPRPSASSVPVVDAAAPAPRAWRFPETVKRPVRDVFFGTEVVDDYRWLEDGASPEVRAWVDAQNALARGHLDRLPERAAVQGRLATISRGGSADWTALRHVPAAGLLFALEARPPKQQEMVVVIDAKKDLAPAEERVVVDPNVLDPSGKTAVDFFVPSPDGKLVAVSLSKDGTESGDVHVFEVASGKALGDVVLRVHGGTAGGSLAWRADGKGFWYTRYPRAGERPEADLGFYQEVWFHTLGEDPAKDLYAFGKGLPKIAEITLEASEDGRAVLAEVSNGDGGEVEHHALTVGTKAPAGKGAPASVVGPWVRLTRFEDEVAHATFGPEGKIYAVTRKGAPHGKVVAFVPPFGAVAETTVLPESEAVLEDLVVTKDALYVVDLLGGPSGARRLPLAPKVEPLAREAPRASSAASKKGGKPKPAAAAPRPPAASPSGVPFAELPLPPVASVSGVAKVGDDLLLRIECYTAPPAWFRYKAS